MQSLIIDIVAVLANGLQNLLPVAVLLLTAPLALIQIVRIYLMISVKKGWGHGRKR